MPQAFNDDTIKLSSHLASPVRPTRPPRPHRPVPPKPSLASLTSSPSQSGAAYVHENAGNIPSTISRSTSNAASVQSGRYDAHTPATNSPAIDVSSTSSSSSSYFVGTNFDSYESKSSSSFPALGRSRSHTAAYYDQRRRRGLAVASDTARESTYTTNTSASDWEREREEAMQNSRSGIFDLEYELEQKLADPSFASPAHEEDSASKHLQPDLSRALAPSPSPSTAGFGLGITSDDAIHPDNPSQPASALASPAAQQYTDGYFGGPPTSAPNSAALSVSPPDSARSRWNMTRPYLRRNTASSVSRSVSRIASNQSLRGQGPQPMLMADMPAEHVSVTSTAQSASAQPHTLQRPHTQDAHRRARRRSPSFSAFSTSSNGHAALATLSYADFSQPDSRAVHSRANSVSTVSTRLEDLEHDLEELDLEQGLVASRRRSSQNPMRPQSQAVALVESGQSSIVRLAPQESLDDLASIRSARNVPMIESWLTC